MKKIVLVIICLALIFSILGCNGSETDLSSNDPTQQTIGIGEMLCSVMALRCEITDSYDELLAISDGTAIIYKIIDNTAYLVTNFHVIHNSFSNDESSLVCESIKALPYGVESADGLDAKCLWYSLEYDLAVLSIENISELFPAATVANIDTSHANAPLDDIVIIGNTDGSGISAHRGSISKIRERVTIPVSYHLPDITLSLIRYDAFVNNGDSGGALYSGDGVLIGLINAKKTDNTGGFAIPATTFVPIIEQVMKDCLSGAEANAYSLRFGAKVTEKYIKTELDPDSQLPYAAYDLVMNEPEIGSVSSLFLEKDDILLGITINDGERISFRNLSSFEDTLLMCRVGDTITWHYKRSGSEMTYTLTLSSAQLKVIK